MGAAAELDDTDAAGWQLPVHRAVPWVALVLAVLGLGESIYLTYDHFRGIVPSCPTHGIIDCAKVTTSAESHVLGIPVALLGLLYFVGVTVLQLPVLWRSQDRRVHWLRLAAAVGGMGFVIYLLVAELFLIGNICLWCTGVHLITFVLFVLVVATAPAMLARPWVDDGEWDDGDSDGEERDDGERDAGNATGAPAAQDGAPTAPAGT